MLLCKNNAGMQSLLAEITWTTFNARFQVNCIPAAALSASGSMGIISADLSAPRNVRWQI